MSGGDLLFVLFAAATCLGAIAVVVSQNVVRMAVWLIVSLASAAALFFLLNADFVGATQLLIYVGGTLVLLIFGVMLTATGPFVQIRTSPAEGFLTGGIGLLFLLMLGSTVASVDWEQNELTLRSSGHSMRVAGGHNDSAVGNTARPLGLAFLGIRPDRDLEQPINSALSAGYFLPFEIVSVHLLVVLVGAAYLARAKRRVDVKHESLGP